MLSRSIVINRTPGESQPRTSSSFAAEQARAEGLLKGRIWGKAIVLGVLVVLLATFLLLNANAVVEPRVRLLFVNAERPGLVPVLIVTSLLSIACTVAARAIYHARAQLDAARGHYLTAGIEREASRLKHASIPHASLPEALIPQASTPQPASTP